MTTIVLVHGKSGVGKDTFCDYVKTFLEEKDIYTLKRPNAQGVKEMARGQFNWDGEKDEKGRQLLIDITRTGYNYDPYFWEQVSYQTIGRIENYLSTLKQDVIVLVPDWRYPCTYQYWKENSYKVVTVHIIKDNNTTYDYSEKITQDKSETELSSFSFDHTIENSGTVVELQDLAKTFAEEVLCI